MKTLSLILLSLFVVACTSAPPALQTGPDAERTYDGLVRVNNSRFQDAWADPEVDFSEYNKVMPGGARFEFRAVSKTAGARHCPAERRVNSGSAMLIGTSSSIRYLESSTRNSARHRGGNLPKKLALTY